MTVPEEQELQPVVQAEPVEALLERYEKPVSDGWLVKFHELPEGSTAYNASDVFMVGEEPHMLVRVEGQRADQEFTSKLAIYRCSADGRECWPTGISNLPELVEGKITQDPAISYVKGNWVITCMEVTPNDLNDPTQGNTHKSVTYSGDSLDRLEHLVDSPEETKGVRYVELLDGRIGIFTRPLLGGRGKICFTVANNWENINTELLASARVIEGLFIDEEWGGANDAELLANGDIALLMHIARFVENGIEGNREYYPAFCVVTPEPQNNPDNPAQANYLQIIARAEDFNISTDELPPKRRDLESVVYPSWLRTASDRGGEAILSAALRDAGQAGIKVPDPLESWRADHLEFADNPFPQSTERLTLAA